MNAREFDVAIIGGGLAGASLAAALTPGEIKVAVIEAVATGGDHDRDRDRDQNPHPPFDGRSIALTADARQIYSQLGVWKQVAHAAQPIREIHVSDRGHFGMTHLRANDAGAGRGALGFVVPAHALGAALHQRMQKNAAVFCPATVQSLQQNESHCELHVLQRGEKVTLRTALVVLADGGRSGLAPQLHINETVAAEYSQRAILSKVSVDRDHHGRAFERFTREGPLALLPCAPRRYAVVWSSDAKNVDRRLALSDEDFVTELQLAFGMRAGAFSAPDSRRAYPLRRGRAHPLGRRALSIGDAGQGFNLGLRDVALLAETLQRAARAGRDLGAREVLAPYANSRRRETARVSGFTDGLLRVFCSRNRAVSFARNLALAGIEICPPAKRMLLWRTMGMAAARDRCSIKHSH